MLEVSLSSLDARELLSRPIEAFHAKSYEIGGDSRILWGTIDIYLRRLDPLVKDMMTDAIIPLERHSSLYRDTRQKLYLEISRMSGFDIKTIQSINISPAGILTIQYPDRQASLNLIERWNTLLLPQDEKNNIQSGAQKARSSLETEVHTAALFDGSILVSYVPATAVALLGAHALYDGGKKGVDMTMYMLDKITIRDENGKMRPIRLKEAYAGTKDAIKNKIVSIMERAGYLWDVVSKGWFSPVERALGATKKEITAQNYSEYKSKNPQSTIAEGEYARLKSEVITQLEKSSGAMWSERVSNISQSLSKNAGEILFFPVFFRHFNTYQNTATLIAGVAEFGTFTLGAKYGAKYIPLPGFFRLLSPLLAGGGAVMLSHVGADAMDISRKKWQYLGHNGVGSLYSRGKSEFLHAAGGWGIQELHDSFNKAGQNMAEMTGIASEDMDIGISRLEIPLPMGGYLGTIPEVNMFQSTVSFGIAPGEWVRGSAGRNVDVWNEKVSLYRDVLIKKISDLLGKYQAGDSMFASERKIQEAGSKEKLLAMHLRDIILGGGESDAFAGESSWLITDLVKYISQDPKTMRKNTIRDIISNRVSQMYVDRLFLEKRNVVSKYKETAMFPALARQISIDKNLFTYLNSIPSNMKEGKSLYQDKNWKKVYELLLADKNTINVDFPTFRGATTVGNAFSLYLDETLKYTRESEFLSEIQKGNKSGVQWTL